MQSTAVSCVLEWVVGGGSVSGEQKQKFARSPGIMDASKEAAIKQQVRTMEDMYTPLAFRRSDQAARKTSDGAA